ncbi:MAG: hypothetical protein EPO27_13205 [Betaproteobacteria bacterium]|nr:MAG: hypothetical protein EPO27_13205 [Betaproteobacteria bacterium]
MAVQEDTMLRKPSNTFAPIAFACMLLSLPARANELDELKSLVKQLQQRIEQLEARQKASVAPAATAEAPPAVTAGSLPGSFKIPGTDTSLQIYGSVRVDATYDSNSRNADTHDNDWASVVFAQPLSSPAFRTGNRKGQFFATAQASRLGIVSSTPTRLGNLEVKLEADFNAPNDYMGELGSNGTLFRLRQAYGKLGNWTVGQTWSNFIDFRSMPETVDFNPPGTVALLRQAQLRYARSTGAHTVSVALENPESLTGNPPAFLRSHDFLAPVYFVGDYDRTPDLTLNWTWNRDDAHLSLRAVTHEYRNDGGHKRGHAFGLGASANVGRGTLVANLQGGKGIGRYMFNSVVQGAVDLGLVPGSTATGIQLWNAMGWHVGYGAPWNASLRSNLIVSRTSFRENAAADNVVRAFWAGIGLDDFVPNRRIDQAFVNLIWAVDKNIEAGIEYAYGKRLTFGGEQGTQQRINGVVRYNLF